MEKPEATEPARAMAFRELGYVAPLPALSAAEAARCRARLEDFIATGSDDMPAMMKRLRTKAHLQCPALFELVQTPAILDHVAEALGPDLLCRACSVFLKEPGSNTNIAWHQDSGYWELDPQDVATAWVALTDSTIENGALEVLPGSHLGPLMPHEIANIPGNILSRGQTITAPIDQAKARPLVLRAGEMSLHHMNIAHRSQPNRSARRRIGVAIRYVAAHVRNTGEHRDSAMLVRGEDRYGHFLHETEGPFAGKAQ